MRDPHPGEVGTRREPLRRRGAWFVAALIAAAVALWTYWPAFSSYLIDDDFQWIDGAMQLGASRAFAVSGRTHFYRPIVEIYFGLMYAATGCSALALHVVSVFIHIVNAWLVMALAWRISRGHGERSADPPALASIAGIIFAAQPGPAQAVLWPSAVSTLLSTTFGLLFLLADLGSQTLPPSPRRTSMVGDRVLAGVPVLLLAAAMGAHESGIMWLPAAVLIRYGMGDRSTVRALARHYTAAFILLIGYAGLTAWINSHNYVVTEGRYAPGAHMVTNVVQYLVALYAGRQRSIEYGLVIVLIAIGLWRGTPRVRAWTLWLLAALTPVLAFTTPPASRYLYVPAIPFCFLVAAGIAAIARRSRVPAWSVALVLTAFVAGRSALFAHKGAEGFRNDAAPYAALASTLSGSRADARLIDPQYLDPLARVATCNPQATFITGR